MRLSEAFEIDGELTERGVRYVVVGHKTEQQCGSVKDDATRLSCFDDVRSQSSPRSAKDVRRIFMPPL